MKKVFYLILASVVSISTTGFRGCNVEGSLQFYNIIGVAFGYSLQLDGPTQPYGITVGDSGRILTSDGRPPAPWTERPSGTTQQLNYVKVADSQDSSIAFAVGNTGTVLRSSDRGYTWSSQSIPSTTRNLYGFDYYGTSGNIVVAGDSGLIMKSTNVGGNWTWLDISPQTGITFKSIVFVAIDIYIAAGEQGKIYRTDNAGATWQIVGIGDTSVYFSRVIVTRPVPDRLWAVGTNGKIFASTSYGNTWFPQASGTTKHLRDVVFRTSNEGIVAGDSGIVRYTTNGGASWLSDPYLDGLTTRDIISVAQVDSNTVDAVTVGRSLSPSPEGSSVDTTFFLAVSSEPLTGVAPVPHVAPESFKLSQNYPNPFNPSTIIAFEIQKRSRVSLKVYSITGAEVATLADEMLEAGRYTRPLNAQNLASGVYLYQLFSDGVSLTRKFMIMR